MFFSSTHSFHRHVYPSLTTTLYLPFAEKLGTAFILVKSDVGGNIDRLSTRAALRPQYLDDIFTIITDEVDAGSHTASASCTKGLLWLKRAMQFITELLNLLTFSTTTSEPAMTMSDAVSQSYASTLQPFHGWIVGSTFTVAFKLAPTRDTFFEKLGVVDEQGSEGINQMAQFCEEYGSILKEIHEFMESNGLNDTAKV
jgi:Ca2+:H+ antiporter